ncbi:MAG: response regulator [Lonepinella koalarum]|nr:response regulator [Lonepinella koalarum]
MAKLLLVDDDLELVELLAELLALEGFTIETASNGQQALNKLDISYDLVLLDIMMPVMDGIETLKQIRQKFMTPVLMLTARGSDTDRVVGLELGADDYLAKPFNDRELIARIKAILRRTSLSKPQLKETSHTHQTNDLTESKCLSFEGIVLNLGGQQALYQGTSLDLTVSEFALLEILVRNPGVVISRELLSIEALGKRILPYDRAIDVHMSNLRKKLPPRENNLPWFRTLRGRGYLLVLDKHQLD